MTFKLTRCLLVVMLLSTFACRDAKEKPLYDRLGGESGITMAMSDFVDRFRNMEDGRINNPLVKRRLAAADAPALKALWVRFISQATGGPDKYEGRTMQRAHAGLEITDEQFDKTIDIMAESLAASKIEKSAQDDLLKMMRAHRSEIVEKR